MITSSPKSTRHNLQPGYISIIAVLSLSTVLLLTLIGAFRFSVQSQDIQRQAQIKIDYAHREQALLRAVLNAAPNRAMQAMMADSASDGSYYNTVRFRWIFEDSLNQSNGEYALSSTDATALAVSPGAISGNSGNGSQGHILDVIDPIDHTSASHPYAFYVTPGINGQNANVGPGYPESLVCTTSAADKDADTPIITREKTYAGGDQYKSIPYPDVHFGYSGQDQTFVAKRNWWAFSVGFGDTTESITGIPVVEKYYVLSIYEVPSQLALGSTTLTYLGQHEDGTDWANVSISGSVFASRAATEGSITLDRIASRKGVSLSSSSSVGGVFEDTFTGTVPSREEYEANHADFFPVSSSSDSGLVAFIPINQGVSSFDDLTDTTDNNRISPTGWNEYSRPALQCAMTLRIEEVIDTLDQTPTQISFTYKSGGIDTPEHFTKGVNWPSSSSTEGAEFPFHLDDTDSGRSGIAIYIERLATYLVAQGADSLEVNNSISINANYRDNPKITKPNIPSLLADNILILRDSADMTAFTAGFSLVTPLRLYLANDVNVVSSGTDASGNAIYPPISLFAPEKRFGIKDEAVEIAFEGQLNYLGKDESTPIRPLDLKSGMNSEIVPDNIQAKLFSISSPSELPPVNQMNWLVTIEEVRP